MNALDYQLLLFLNQILNQSSVLTKAVVTIYGDGLKSAFIVALLWWAWFDAKNGAARQEETRARIAACFCGSLVCILLVRVLAVLLPFRTRPINIPDLGMHFPISAEGWGQWSAFPSDNAVLFFFLSTCLFSISRTMGILALLDTALLICLPRVLVGVHYPTDILGGAAIGVAGAYAVDLEWARSRLSKPVLLWAQVHSASFYAAAFLLSYLIATVFWPALRILMSGAKFVQFMTR